MVSKDAVTLKPSPDLSLPVSKKYYAEFVQRVIILEDATLKWFLKRANLSEEQ